jgi:hypothetical protein
MINSTIQCIRDTVSGTGDSAESAMDGYASKDSEMDGSYQASHSEGQHLEVRDNAPSLPNEMASVSATETGEMAGIIPVVDLSLSLDDSCEDETCLDSSMELEPTGSAGVCPTGPGQIVNLEKLNFSPSVFLSKLSKFGDEKQAEVVEIRPLSQGIVDIISAPTLPQVLPGNMLEKPISKAVAIPIAWAENPQPIDSAITAVYAGIPPGVATPPRVASGNVPQVLPVWGPPEPMVTVVNPITGAVSRSRSKITFGDLSTGIKVLSEMVTDASEAGPSHSDTSNSTGPGSSEDELVDPEVSKEDVDLNKNPPNPNEYTTPFILASLGLQGSDDPVATGSHTNSAPTSPQVIDTQGRELEEENDSTTNNSVVSVDPFDGGSSDTTIEFDIAAGTWTPRSKTPDQGNPDVKMDTIEKNANEALEPMDTTIGTKQDKDLDADDESDEPESPSTRNRRLFTKLRSSATLAKAPAPRSHGNGKEEERGRPAGRGGNTKRGRRRSGSNRRAPANAGKPNLGDGDDDDDESDNSRPFGKIGRKPAKATVPDSDYATDDWDDADVAVKTAALMQPSDPQPVGPWAKFPKVTNHVAPERVSDYRDNANTKSALVKLYDITDIPMVSAEMQRFAMYATPTASTHPFTAGYNVRCMLAEGKLKKCAATGAPLATMKTTSTRVRNAHPTGYQLTCVEYWDRSEAWYWNGSLFAIGERTAGGLLETHRPTQIKPNKKVRAHIDTILQERAVGITENFHNWFRFYKVRHPGECPYGAWQADNVKDDDQKVLAGIFCLAQNIRDQRESLPSSALHHLESLHKDMKVKRWNRSTNNMVIWTPGMKCPVKLCVLRNAAFGELDIFKAHWMEVHNQEAGRIFCDVPSQRGLTSHCDYSVGRESKNMIKFHLAKIHKEEVCQVMNLSQEALDKANTAEIIISYKPEDAQPRVCAHIGLNFEGMGKAIWDKVYSEPGEIWVNCNPGREDPRLAQRMIFNKPTLPYIPIQGDVNFGKMDPALGYIGQAVDVDVRPSYEDKKRKNSDPDTGFTEVRPKAVSKRQKSKDSREKLKTDYKQSVAEASKTLMATIVEYPPRARYEPTAEGTITLAKFEPIDPMNVHPGLAFCHRITRPGKEDIYLSPKWDNFSDKLQVTHALQKTRIRLRESVPEGQDVTFAYQTVCDTLYAESKNPLGFLPTWDEIYWVVCQAYPKLVGVNDPIKMMEGWVSAALKDGEEKHKHDKSLRDILSKLEWPWFDNESKSLDATEVLEKTSLNETTRLKAIRERKAKICSDMRKARWERKQLGAPTEAGHHVIRTMCFSSAELKGGVPLDRGDFPSKQAMGVPTPSIEHDDNACSQLSGDPPPRSSLMAARKGALYSGTATMSMASGFAAQYSHNRGYADAASTNTRSVTGSAADVDDLGQGMSTGRRQYLVAPKSSELLAHFLKGNDAPDQNKIKAAVKGIADVQLRGIPDPTEVIIPDPTAHAKEVMEKMKEYQSIVRENAIAHQAVGVDNLYALIQQMAKEKEQLTEKAAKDKVIIETLTLEVTGYRKAQGPNNILVDSKQHKRLEKEHAALADILDETTEKLMTFGTNMDKELTSGCSRDSLYAMRPRLKQDKSVYEPFAKDEAGFVTSRKNRTAPLAEDPTLSVSGYPAQVAFDGPNGSWKVDLNQFDAATRGKMVWLTAVECSNEWKKFAAQKPVNLMQINTGYQLDEVKVARSLEGLIPKPPASMEEEEDSAMQTESPVLGEDVSIGEDGIDVSEFI